MSTATTNRAPSRPCRARSRSGKSRQRIGAEQDQAADVTPDGRGRACRAVSRPGPSGRAAPHACSYQARPASRLTRPGSRPGARPMSRAPCTLARRRADRNATPGRPATSTAAAAATCSSGSASDGRPRITTTAAASGPSFSRASATSRRAASMVGRGHARHVARPGPSRPRAAARAVASPGRYSSGLGWRRALSPVACGVSSTTGRPPSRTACAEAQVQDRHLVFDVGPEQDDRRGAGRPGRWWPGAGRGPSRRGGRRRAGRRRCRSRAPPGPAWPRRRRPRWAGGPRR